MPVQESAKTERIVARVNPRDKALLYHAAALKGESVSSFLLSSARQAAKTVIAEEEEFERIYLNLEESKRFVEALQSPRPPSKKLLEAVNDYRERGISR